MKFWFDNINVLRGFFSWGLFFIHLYRMLFYRYLLGFYRLHRLKRTSNDIFKGLFLPAVEAAQNNFIQGLQCEFVLVRVRPSRSIPELIKSIVLTPSIFFIYNQSEKISRSFQPFLFFLFKFLVHILDKLEGHHFVFLMIGLYYIIQLHKPLLHQHIFKLELPYVVLFWHLGSKGQPLNFVEHP